MSRALAFPDQPRRLEAVDARHAHVQEDHRKLLLQDAAQRLFAGIRQHQVLPQALQQLLQRHEISPVIVDDQDAGHR